MKPKEIQITIPKPCNADWELMEPVSGGRHCLSCRKTVVDVSNLSPEKILDVFRKQRGNACIRIQSDMLDTPIQVGQPRWYSFIVKNYRKVAVFIGMQFLFWNQVKA